MDVEWADLHPALVVWGWRHKAGKGCVSYRWELEAVKKLKLEYTKAVFAADDDEGGTDSSSEVRIVSSNGPTTVLPTVYSRSIGRVVVVLEISVGRLPWGRGRFELCELLCESYHECPHRSSSSSSFILPSFLSFSALLPSLFPAFFLHLSFPLPPSNALFSCGNISMATPPCGVCCSSRPPRSRS